MAKATSTLKSSPSSKNVTKAKALAAKSTSKTPAKAAAAKSAAKSSEKISKADKTAKLSPNKSKLTVKKADKTSTAPVSARLSESPTESGSSKAAGKAKTAKTSDEAQQLLLTPKSNRQMPSEQDRQKMVEEAAYHLAEQDGFQPGQEHAYWVRAEAQIEKLLSEQSSDSADIH